MHRQHVARVVSGVDVPKGEQAAKHHACAHQQHERERHLAHDEQAARADADGALVTAALFQRVIEIGPAGPKRGQSSGEDAGENGRSGDEQQHAHIDRDLVGSRHLFREQGRAGAEPDAREEQAGRAPGGREHQRFDE